MNKKLKTNNKILSVILALLMIISAIPVTELTAFAATSDNFEYIVLGNGTAEITNYTGSAETLEIPSTLGGHTVTSIGDDAFWGCYSLTSVTIPNSVTSIGDYAFHGCYCLTSVDLGNSVESIGDYAFYGCSSLTSITIPNSVTSIGKGAFDSCYRLTSITIPDSVTSIGNEAFDSCTSLTSITIPNSVASIGDDAFYYCKSLESIIVDADNPYYSSQDGILFDKNKTELIQYPVGNKRTSYTIPNSVTTIGYHAFYGCNSLTNVTIPDGVTTIGDYAFYGCGSLESITIPNSVTSIGEWAFSGCTSLTSVDFGDGVESIGYGAFQDCYCLTSITIYNRKCEIDDSEYTISDKATIYGYNGSTAQAYAEKYGRKFVALDKCTTHKWDGGKITKAATCKETGVKTYTCTVCGETKTETIAKKAHTYKNYVTEKATTKKSGSIVTKCTVCGAVKSKSTIYYPKTITLSTTSYTYSGKAKKPSVTVKDSKGKKIASSNYTVTYPSGRKNVGKYTITIKFKGSNYSGTVKKTFTIKPKATSLSKLTAKKKGFTVKWKKLTTQTTGYQIQYSTSSKFKSAKTVTVSKNKTTSKTISKLKAKKKYYVRIRTYKTVKVSGKSTKIYSSWSKAKSVKTK